ncbi:hypothetical protein BJ322DRAFT_1108159 [Thelephora terrestris]|uniref:Uncharacterized protein n=1 Tax=Thelephora terrestris TaxID=56493 RepID=A0A9P6L7R6_9AGAM|nr:hypothetical protein BJ322DRAFT_1108159 [Thelephora terrestris]
MSHICYEGHCASAPRVFSGIRGFRQHLERSHQDTPEDQTSLGNSRDLKHKRDEEEEEQRKRNREAQLALEAMNCEPEALPVPLLDRAIDTGLQRSTRVRRLPARFRDPLPAPSLPIPHTIERSEELDQQSSLEPGRGGVIEGSIDSLNRSCTITNVNSFGVFREYLAVSSHNPRNPDAFADAHPPLAPPQSLGSSLMAVIPPDPGDDPLANSNNISEDLLLAWSTRGPGNTPAGVNDLVHNVIRHPGFHPSALEDFNAITAIRNFERKWISQPGGALKAGDGWREGSVSIRVPCTGVAQKESEAPEFVVKGILYRDIVEVITTELEDPNTFNDIHVAPHKEWWNPGPGEDPVRIYSETFNSDAITGGKGSLTQQIHCDYIVIF